MSKEVSLSLSPSPPPSIPLHLSLLPPSSTLSPPPPPFLPPLWPPCCTCWF
jgi:hypothetical protein